MSTVAAKDVWVRTPTRVVATPTAAVGEALRLPAPATDHGLAVSSPRVLSDLFWLGRYAERAESTARLLHVTRERYHEFRYRRELSESECVPVLLAALGRITGTDTGSAHAVGAHRRPAQARLAGTVGGTAWDGRPCGP
jgi:hypothetical protein